MSLSILPLGTPPPTQHRSFNVPMAVHFPVKKPKLSLNTSDVPSVFSKGSTSLRLDVMAATASPTTRNTINNALQCTRANRVGLAERTGLNRLNTRFSGVVEDRTSALGEGNGASSPESQDLPMLTGSASSASSASTIDSLPSTAPYNLAPDLISILSNGPLSTFTKAEVMCSVSFPRTNSQKKVSFQDPLIQVIDTSDLDSLSIISPLSAISSSPISTLNPPTVIPTNPRGIAPMESGDKRDSSEDEDSDVCPKTPMAGRRKRQRMWEWTLSSPTLGESSPLALSGFAKADRACTREDDVHS